MVVANDLEKYFLALADVKWRDNLIKSDGTIVAKGGCFGRMFGCFCASNYSIVKAQKAVLEKVNAYMSHGKKLGTVIESERLDIVLPALKRINELVEYVRAKKPKSTLQKIERTSDIVFKFVEKEDEAKAAATPPIKRIASSSLGGTSFLEGKGITK